MPLTSAIRNRATKMKKSTFAIPAAVDATPPNPKNAATIETMKNINAHFSMAMPPLADGSHQHYGPEKSEFRGRPPAGEGIK